MSQSQRYGREVDRRRSEEETLAEIGELRNHVRSLEQTVLLLKAQLVANGVIPYEADESDRSFAAVWNKEEDESSDLFFDAAYVDDRARTWFEKDDRRKADRRSAKTDRRKADRRKA